MNIHIVSIAGTITAPLANKLKSLGHHVTGSDQEKIYPPVSDILKQGGITINNTSITPKIDQAIIGASYKFFQKTRDEFDQIQKQGIPYLSITQYLAQYLIKPNSILVAGAYGKTTITAALTWIFKTAGHKPNYMFGGQAINPISSLDMTGSDWSIVEADESINGLDTQAKFLYYPGKHLILTSADWEHKDSYPSYRDNFKAFLTLVKRLPPKGTLLINSRGADTRKLASVTPARVVSYNGPQADYNIIHTNFSGDTTRFCLHTPKGELDFTTPLFGEFNLQNLSAAIGLSLELGIPHKTIAAAISTFLGIKRRLELIAHTPADIRIFDDFAQSPPRIEAAIKALHSRFPHSRLLVFLEPHAAFLQTKKGLHGLKHALESAAEIVVSRIKFSSKVPKSDRALAADFKEEIGPPFTYLPVYTDIIDHYSRTLQPKDVLVHFSSGGLAGLKSLVQIVSSINSIKG